VSKDMSVKKMVLEHELLENIPLHAQELNCGESVYELKDHVGEKALILNLPLKLGLIRKIPLASFPNHLLETI